MSNYPEIEIDKERGYVIAHNEDGSYKNSISVESLILAKILFELERIGLALESLDERTRKTHPM
jgi:hypothetical protein